MRKTSEEILRVFRHFYDLQQLHEQHDTLPRQAYTEMSCTVQEPPATIPTFTPFAATSKN